MKVCLIAIAVLFSFHVFAETSASLKKDFLKRFPLKEGHYSSVAPAGQNWEYCQNEEVDVALHELGDELILTIGPRLVFPNLQARDVTSDLEKNCFVRTTNTFENNTLQQVVTEACDSKVDSKKTHILQVSGYFLNYQYSNEGQIQSCKYQWMKEASK